MIVLTQVDGRVYFDWDVDRNGNAKFILLHQPLIISELKTNPANTSSVVISCESQQNERKSFSLLQNISLQVYCVPSLFPFPHRLLVVVRAWSDVTAPDKSRILVTGNKLTRNAGADTKRLPFAAGNTHSM